MSTIVKLLFPLAVFAACLTWAKLGTGAPTKKGGPNLFKSSSGGDGVDIQFSRGMRFGLTLWEEGKPIRLTCYPDGQSNSTFVRIDGKEVEYGSPAGEWESQKKDTKEGGVQSIWKFDRLQITQELKLVKSEGASFNDTCLVLYHVKPLDNRTRKVDLRVTLDTCVGDNDGCPFEVPGREALVASKDDFKDKEVPAYAKALQRNNPKNPGAYAHLTLQLNKEQFGLTGAFQYPTRFSITRWGFGFKGWEVPVVDMAGDSAVALYWSSPVAPQGATMGYAYGKGALKKP